LAWACERPEVLAVVVYGSAVRDVEDSADVDLLVVHTGDDQPPFTAPPLDVDVRAYPGAEIDARIAAGHDVLGWALRYGIPAYERECFWSGLVSRWKHRLPLPSAEIAEERAAKARRYYQELSAVGDADAAREQLVAMLTHQARARLLRAGVFPGSRPELPGQLIGIGELALADELSDVTASRAS
jgi:hypothetical protein